MAKRTIADLKIGETGFCSQRALVMVGTRLQIDTAEFFYTVDQKLATLKIHRSKEGIKVYRDTVNANMIYVMYHDDRYLPVTCGEVHESIERLRRNVAERLSDER